MPLCAPSASSSSETSQLLTQRSCVAGRHCFAVTPSGWSVRCTNRPSHALLLTEIVSPSTAISRHGRTCGPNHRMQLIRFRRVVYY
jgi:hypothetical protein